MTAVVWLNLILAPVLLVAIVGLLALSIHADRSGV
jgi:hypothetical protein